MVFYDEQEVLKAGFHRLAERWKQETKFSSSATEVLAHPAYEAIIREGTCLLPYILADLELTGAYWFLALQRITGEDPLSGRTSCTYDEQMQAWLRWGRENGYLAPAKKTANPDRHA
ncbi:MAG: hypothetical protein HYZ53_02935 [Planctomycetes bacterium]|nr:hypothetical protein [Planctomycetota bacterium]